MNVNSLIKEVEKVEEFQDLYNVPWKYFLNKKSSGLSNVKVLLLSSPCFGMGDIIFAMKINQYIKSWFDAKVTIATTQPDKFIQLGESKKNLLLLKGKSSSSQCRRFKTLSLYNLNNKSINLPVFDLIFVTPLNADFTPDYKDVSYIVPYANQFNTFFFSEYNDSIGKNIDFHTGVGDERLGLLMTEIKKDKKLPQLKNRYSVIYIAQTIDGYNKCFMGFMEMVAKKYSKQYKKFDIVVPDWMVEYIIHDHKNRIIKLLSKYYGTIVTKTKDGEEYLIENDDNVLTIRGDILPLQNKDMLRLIKYSVRDILLTGDQSITDAISCCSGEKNIFYQIAPWKENFGRHLSKELPNKYLQKKSTSCGTIQAIKYHSNYGNFKKKWDFRKLAKKKLTAIFSAAFNRKKDSLIQDFENIVLSSKTLTSFDKKFDEMV